MTTKPRLNYARNPLTTLKFFCFFKQKLRSKALVKVLSGINYGFILLGLLSSGWAYETNDDQRFSFSGYLKFSSSYQFTNDKPKKGETDFRGINELKSSLFLRIDTDLLPGGFKARVDGKTFYDAIYRIRGREKYNDQTLDTYELDVELMNCYIEGQMADHIDIKVGRQVIIWGVADSFRITDVLNPIDYLEPGRTELSELRLPVFMVKLDYYTGPFSFSFIGAPEHRWNRYPVFGSNFYPIDYPMNDEDESISIENMDYAIALKASLSGSDISIYLADYKNKTPHMKADVPFSEFNLHHDRVKMIGGDINYAWKNILFKSEAAFFSGVHFSDYLDGSREAIRISDKTYEKVMMLCGIEYMGFKDSYFALEVLNTWINGYDKILEQSKIPENSLQLSVKWVYSFLNDAGMITLHSLFDGKPIHQVKVSYDLSDDLTLSGGILLFESGKHFLYKNMGNKDMLFFDIKYYF